MIPVNVMATEGNSIQVGIRMSKALYEKLVRKQQEAKRLTGFEPSIAEVIRLLIERGT